MTVGTGRQPSGIITINGKPYALLKDEHGIPQWRWRTVPTQEGDPTVARRQRWSDWSRGMGDSRGLFSGATESSSNAYLGMTGRILPGPKVTEIATGHTAQVTKFVDVTLPANRIISFGGRYAKEIDPAAFTVSATGDFTAGKTVTDAQLFIDQVAIALGDATQFYRRKADGSYAVSTATSDANGDYRYATAFGLSTEGDLVRGRGATWSKCSAADFYATNGNWTVEYTIGDASGNVRKVMNFETWDYVLKDEGLYSFDQASSKERNVLPDLRAFKSAENANWFAWYNRLFLCTYAGLYRYIQQGGARTVGVEEQELNEGILTNAYPTAGVAFGKWAYVAYYDGTTSYICMMRNALNGDATLGSPFTMVSVIDSFTGKCPAMHVSALPAAPTVFYAGPSGAVRYFALTRDGRPATYRDSGSTVVTLSPIDLDSPATVKYARGLEVVGRNASAARAIQLAAAWDDGSFNNVDTAITAYTNGYAEKFWTVNSNDHGRKLQLKATMALDSTTTPPEIREIFLNFEERPLQVPGAVAVLRFRDNDREGEVELGRSAYEQKAEIDALFDGGPVTLEDVDGATYVAALSQHLAYLRITLGDILKQGGGEPAESTYALAFRKLSYASE